VFRASSVWGVFLVRMRTPFGSNRIVEVVRMRTPFGSNRIVEGRYPGSFRRMALFSRVDGMTPPPPSLWKAVFRPPFRDRGWGFA